MTITRFAPSPTGFLHIGGARTALFNYLYAKHHNGKFLLRIEDTDQSRSSQEAVDAILDSMQWLGINWDDEIIYQSQNAARHTEIVEQLLATGKAYKCYCTPEELTEMREKAQAEKRGFRYDGRWRDKSDGDAPFDISPSIRLKAPTEGSITISDKLQGNIVTQASELDDMIIMRSDGTPTYMLAVVVDDHDMGVTNIIRGDDHLTNAARQQMIYNAMGWKAPTFTHIPLIHGADGTKLSKRHGALGAEQYREMGYLPEAICNYLLRLGWSHGDDEIISREQAIEWFATGGFGKGASRFDLAKLDHLNGHYIRESSDDRLVELITPLIEDKLNVSLETSDRQLLIKALPSLKQRVKTLLELADNSLFYFKKTSIITPGEKAQNQIDNVKDKLPSLVAMLESQTNWEHDSLMENCKSWGESNELKLGKVMAPIRVAITGTTTSPSMFEVMELLGKDESITRLKNIL